LFWLQPLFHCIRRSIRSTDLDEGYIQIYADDVGLCMMLLSSKTETHTRMNKDLDDQQSEMRSSRAKTKKEADDDE
jgi:hypothetical protein